MGEKPARDFVTHHHYSRSFPAARLRVGLYRSRPFNSPELVGVAIFGVCIQPRAIVAHAKVPASEGVELSRFVLLDDVEANGETWFLARAFKHLRREKPDVRVVLAYSDPVERTTAEGVLIKPGHQGGIYKAFNGAFVGYSGKRTLTLAPDGRVVSDRMLSKLRLGETGADYAYRTLVALGAPRRSPGEGDAEYVARALREGPWRRLKHPGNLAYTWNLPIPRNAATVREAEQLGFDI